MKRQFIFKKIFPRGQKAPWVSYDLAGHTARKVARVFFVDAGDLREAVAHGLPKESDDPRHVARVVEALLAQGRKFAGKAVFYRLSGLETTTARVFLVVVVSLVRVTSFKVTRTAIPEGTALRAYLELEAPEGLDLQVKWRLGKRPASTKAPKKGAKKQGGHKAPRGEGAGYRPFAEFFKGVRLQ